MWIMVDPTWGSTTGGVDYFHQLDFDHFAFVIKGESSTYPIPAGGYNYTNDPITKDVQVGFSTVLPNETPSFSLASTIPQEAIAGLPIQGNVLIKNTGSAYIPGQLLTVGSNIFNPHEETLQTSGIPPFGTLQVPISFHPTNPITDTIGTYTIRVAGVSIKKSVHAKFFFFTPISWIIDGIIIAAVCGILILQNRK